TSSWATRRCPRSPSSSTATVPDPTVPDPTVPDPRDPRGLRGDAPLLDAWLRFTEWVDAGALTPMCVPGHKQRQDLVGPVVAGGAPPARGRGAPHHPAAGRAGARGPPA